MPASARHAADSTTVRAADEVPAWFVWLSLIVVAGPSLFALAYFQHRLLTELWPGVPAGLTIGLALAVDSFGAMCGMYWFRSRRNQTLRKWGRTFAILAVLGSTALMVWSIARVYPGAQALGVIPAVIVFGTTKLVTMWQADRATNRDVLAEAAAQVADAEARAQRAHDTADAAVTDRDGQVAELAAQLAEIREQLAARPARLALVPASAEVTGQDDAPTRPIPQQELPPVDADNPAHVERVADWIRTETGPTGQRKAADQFGVSRAQIADVHKAAVALVATENLAGDDRPAASGDRVPVTT